MLNQMIWGNSIQSWLIAIMIFILSYGLLKLVIAFFERRIKKISIRTVSLYDDYIWIVLNQTKSIFLAFLSLLIASKSLILPAKVITFINVSVIIFLWIQIGLWANQIIIIFIQSKKTKGIDGKEKTSLSAIGTISKIFIWSIVLLLALDNIPGIQISALIASLGIGGIAVGLALQNILGDLFASLSITIDQPFVIGDFISIENFSGSVEKIGLKSTRVRSITGEELVFSNSDLLSGRIHNYKRMDIRRVVMQFGVTYQITVDKLKKIPEILQSIVKSQSNVTFERAHLSTMGDFTINYELVFTVNSPDFTLYMNIKENILLSVLQKFEEEGIDMPYPTQTVLLKKLEQEPSNINNN